MKKWNCANVEKLRQADRNARPKPFPGKFPTRVFWEVKHEDGRSWRYIGKPSINTVNKYFSYARQTGIVSAKFWEFDRSWLIAGQISHGAIARVRNTTASPLLEYYHPFWAATTVPGADQLKFYSNKVGGHWIYSAGPQLTHDQIEYHTNWLRGRMF